MNAVTAASPQTGKAFTPSGTAGMELDRIAQQADTVKEATYQRLQLVRAAVDRIVGSAADDVAKQQAGAAPRNGGLVGEIETALYDAQQALDDIASELARL